VYGLLMMNLPVAAVADPRSAAPGTAGGSRFLENPDNQRNRTLKRPKTVQFWFPNLWLLGLQTQHVGAWAVAFWINALA